MGKCIHKAKYINTREATTPSFGFRNIELGPHGLGPASKMYLKQDVLYPWTKHLKALSSSKKLQGR